MTKTRNSIASQIAPTNRAAYTASDTILFESFEAWDGSFNWMPTDWTEFSASESTLSATTGYNTTWQAYQTDGYYAPYATNGAYVAMVQYGYDFYDEDGSPIPDDGACAECDLTPYLEEDAEKNAEKGGGAE